jgi:hypothetical protein
MRKGERKTICEASYMQLSEVFSAENSEYPCSVTSVPYITIVTSGILKFTFLVIAFLGIPLSVRNVRPDLN